MTGALSAFLVFFLLPAVWLSQAQEDKQTSAQPQSSPSQASPTPSLPSPSATLPDSTRLEVISAPRPIYPKQAAEKELQGEVWIKLLISENGDVETAETVSGNPILAKAAADAMIKWKFKPYIKKGRAVKVSTKLPFDFALEGQVSDPHRAPAADLAVAPVSPIQPAPASSPSSSPPVRRKLRVSQGVMDSNIVHRVEPVYPPEAKRNHIQGTVLLRATIGKDGRIHDLSVISGPPELVEASMGAIEQWRYRPYTLNGEPVEVETTIKVQFHM